MKHRSRRPQAAGLEVQSKQCSTCIYRPDSPIDLASLEAQIADGYGGFRGARICHHSDGVVCRGFWNRHKNRFAAGQIAQRLGCVLFVEVDTLADRGRRRKGGKANA